MATKALAERRQMGWRERISSDFTTLAWVMIPVGVAINVIGGFLTGLLALPLFFDTIGTILLAIIAGPWVAVVAGVLTNIILGFVRSPTFVPFALVQVGIALVVGYMALYGWFYVEETKDYIWVLAAGLVVTITSVVTSTPIAVFLFGGLTGHPVDLVTGFFLATGSELIAAVLAQSFIIGLADKVISVVVAFFIVIAIPDRYRPEFGQKVLSSD